MKITADTNVLLRIILHDDLRQKGDAETILERAELVAITAAALCEFVWVITRGYKLSGREAAAAVQTLVNAGNVVADRQAIEAGLAMLDAGGDFADGVIAYQGAALGAETFVTFDRQAVKLLKDQGQDAQLLD